MMETISRLPLWLLLDKLYGKTIPKQRLICGSESMPICTASFVIGKSIGAGFILYNVTQRIVVLIGVILYNM